MNDMVVINKTLARQSQVERVRALAAQRGDTYGAATGRALRAAGASTAHAAHVGGVATYNFSTSFAGGFVRELTAKQA